MFSIAIVIAAFLIGNSYLNKNRNDGTILVTGLGKADFVSDLIVWEGDFSSEALTLKQAYAGLEKDKKIISEYMKTMGVKAQSIVFDAVRSRKNMERKYSTNGKYIGEEFRGYILTQNIKIKSKEVEKVEKISREITKLLNKGVAFYSKPPRYYYTKLADLKIEMISRATEDARLRAEKISENSGAELGKLVSAKMGIFQITGQYSNESYSWGGTFNTSSKEKTASITMKLNYKVK